MVVIYSDSYGKLHIRNKLWKLRFYIGTKEGEIFCGIR
jgi:hypothetical protein